MTNSNRVSPVLLGSSIGLLAFIFPTIARAQQAVDLTAARSNAVAAPSETKMPPPPADFDHRRADVSHGRVERVEFDSKIVGAKRPAVVYTPPGYSTNNNYPVLYLLHGVAFDETGWTQTGAADVILDNLFADHKAVPMIVVMPNGRASADASPQRRGARGGGSPDVFANFENVLLTELVPYVESHYAVAADREHRALAGQSMGGGQALNFGLAHLDTFAWVAGFSPAPNTKPPAELVPNSAEATRQLDLLWVSCGDRDGLMNVSRGLHDYLQANNVPHVWHIGSGAHDFSVWKSDLYHFAPLLFRR